MTKDTILIMKRAKLYRITIRATDESVPPVLMKIMEETYSRSATETMITTMDHRGAAGA